MDSLQKHKEAWHDFEVWYDTDFYFKQKTHIRGRAILYSLPFEMQLGVYLKYLDEKVMEFKHIIQECRPSEFPAAIEQAFKIRNQQLIKEPA